MFLGVMIKRAGALEGIEELRLHAYLGIMYGIERDSIVHVY